MVSSRKNLSEELAGRQGTRLLRISDVARRVGISSSALRAWEALGLVTPLRTQSRYRLYTEADVRLLQRAIFLRRARGLNPVAIVQVLKRQGVVSAVGETQAHPGQRFRRLRTRRGLSLAQVARATGVSVGFLSSLERGQMRSSIATLRRIARFYRTNILSLFETAGEHPRLVRPAQRKILAVVDQHNANILIAGKSGNEKLRPSTRSPNAGARARRFPALSSTKRKYCSRGHDCVSRPRLHGKCKTPVGAGRGHSQNEDRRSRKRCRNRAPRPRSAEVD